MVVIQILGQLQQMAEAEEHTGRVTEQEIQVDQEAVEEAEAELLQQVLEINQVKMAACQV
jgi:CBS domain containing-hemolysin-like protein